MRKIFILICMALMLAFPVKSSAFPPLPMLFDWLSANLRFVTVEKSADAVTLTANECSDTLITNRGWDGADDQTFTLPAAVQGLKFKFLAVVASGGTADTYFDTPGSSTNIYLTGASVGDGERIWTQEIAVAESITCHTATIDGTTYEWFCDPIVGTWADKGS